MSKANLNIRSNKNEGQGHLIRLLSIVSLIGGLQLATQYFAHQFNYQPQLGAHLFHIYEPWSILVWANKWHSYYPGFFDMAASIGILFSSIGLIMALFLKMVQANSSTTNHGLYGSARWANKKDIENAGLIRTRKKHGNDSVYVGAWEENSRKTHYLKHYGPEHVLCYAPTRSGKGVSLVIPTLLAWPQSAVITDLKGELWALTAGWRKEYAHNKVLRFDPASMHSAHWNRLMRLRLEMVLKWLKYRIWPHSLLIRTVRD